MEFPQAIYPTQNDTKKIREFESESSSPYIYFRCCYLPAVTLVLFYLKCLEEELRLGKFRKLQFYLY